MTLHFRFLTSIGLALSFALVSILPVSAATYDPPGYTISFDDFHIDWKDTTPDAVQPAAETNTDRRTTARLTTLHPSLKSATRYISGEHRIEHATRRHRPPIFA